LFILIGGQVLSTLKILSYENDNFIIFYSVDDQTYIEQIIYTLSSNMKRIMDFFQIQGLTEKKEIILWNNRNKYAEYLKIYVDQYQDWMIADTFNYKINIVSFHLYKNGECHKNCTLNDYMKVIVHEFVHICQQEINPVCNDVIWFWEALATNLSKQMYNLVDFPYTSYDIMYNYKNIRDFHSVSYTLGRYLLDNYTKSQILMFVQQPNKLREVTECIISNTKNWLLQLNK
jgi:hypothetical protein